MTEFIEKIKYKKKHEGWNITQEHIVLWLDAFIASKPPNNTQYMHEECLMMLRVSHDLKVIRNIGWAKKLYFPSFRFYIRIGEQNSMIFQHVANNNHNMDFSNPTVLAKNQHPLGRRILETFYSQNSTRAINRFMEVPDVYFPVVRKHLNLVEH